MLHVTLCPPPQEVKEKIKKVKTRRLCPSPNHINVICVVNVTSLGTLFCPRTNLEGWLGLGFPHFHCFLHLNFSWLSSKWYLVILLWVIFIRSCSCQPQLQLLGQGLHYSILRIIFSRKDCINKRFFMIMTKTMPTSHSPQVVILEVYLGLAWATGACVFGCIVVQVTLLAKSYLGVL